MSDTRVVGCGPEQGDLVAWSQRLRTSTRIAGRRMDYSKIITIEANKRGGKPCIRGLRITVYDVLDYLAGGMSFQEILGDFPDLTEDDIRACLAFAADRERRMAASPTA